MKRTWKLRSILGEAPVVMATSATVTAAAKTLGVDRGTVHRWVKAGRIPAPSGRRRGGEHIPAVPEGWAAAVRARYDLDATETTLVELAEAALALARDTSLKPADRLAAMARFAQLVRQIDLEVPDGETQTRLTPTPDPDPRGLDVSDRHTRHAPDPRWLLSPQAGRIAAHRYFLLTGEYPDCRLRGWVALAQDEHGAPTAEDVWLQYRTDLIAEARSAGFEPHRLTGRRPKSGAFAPWRMRFLAQHRY